MASVVPAESGVMDSPWAHGWDTVGQAWWGDFGYSLLNNEQATFIANNYFLASLEKCTGAGEGLFSEQGIYQTAKQLKAINPKVKTTFYWHTGQAGIRCYAAETEFLAHKEWWCVTPRADRLVLTPCCLVLTRADGVC